MLVGIDWGGTKIEAVAMTPAGAELFRQREDTPRGDYAACLAYKRLPQEILQYNFTTVFTTRIVKSVHGDSSGVRGAAWLWAEDRA